MRRPRATLALSLGCPAGIGPEVAVAAAAAAPGVRCILVGDEDVVRQAARARRVAQRRIVAVASADEAAQLGVGAVGVWSDSAPLAGRLRPGRPHRGAGVAQLAWIDQAADLVSDGVCQALVTGPVSKAAIASSGAPGAKRFRGHTEHLAARLGAEEVVMAFSSERLTTALVTTHLPLRRVARLLDPAAVASACYWLAAMLARLRTAGSRIGVASLNPHAGEDGLLGDEEKSVIAPGMARARRRIRREGLVAELVGPLGAETAYRRAAAGELDGVVAMYHDQATIPMKLLGFGDAVNVTLGLPIVRTSVDHGTAYDLAWSGRASPRGMSSALELAAALVAGRSTRR